ncbi:hypothetical protein JXA63_05745 [Candidatus Woesebacteria bacterium]|nr:hypothetical protein [Candidatus Woesebacteria bacterium]
MEINKEVSDYINQQLQKGISPNSIKAAFLQKGWKEEVISSYLDEIVNNFSADQNINNQEIFTKEEDPVEDNIDKGSSGDLPGPVELLKQSWKIYKRSWKTLVGVILIPYMMILVFVMVLGWVKVSSPPLSLVLAVYFVSISLAIFFIWMQLALVYSVVFSGEGIGIKESYRRSFKKIFSYLWLLFLSGSLVFSATIFFVVPGIIFSIWLVVDIYVLIAEDVKGLSAIIKSREYVREYWWKVVGRTVFLIILGIVIILLPDLSTYLVRKFLAGIELPELVLEIPDLVFQILIPLVLTPIEMIYFYLLYFYLKRIKGNFEFNPSRKRKIKYILVAIFGTLLVPAMIVLVIVLALKPKESFSRARDAQRMATKNILERSLESYYIGNDKYPISLDELVPNELDELPKDSKTGIVYYSYESLEDGKNYSLCIDYELKETECVNSARNRFERQNIYKPTIPPYTQYTPSNTNIQ